MKKDILRFSNFIFSLFAFITGWSSLLHAEPGDTLTVQTFTFGSPQEGWFVMPSDTFRSEKIYMLYTLKCNPNQNPACGEWDYLTYTYQYQPTIDSSIVNGANYQVNGLSPDSFSYITETAFQLKPYWQNFQVNTDTISYSATTIGVGANSSPLPFKTSYRVSRTQYLWTASELSAAGLTAGNITAIQFDIISSDGIMHHLSVRMKNSVLDSLTNSLYENSGFTLCYESNTNFVSGWNSIPFTTPFNWDGTSNIDVEITFDNTISSNDYSIASDVASWKNAINTSADEHSAHFNDNNYISVPKEAFASVDSEITIAFWFKGDNFLQDRTAFEAYNQYGYRILNVHLPWSDQNIYWDAGCEMIGSYDRINKHADVGDYENAWHYWAFTKNVSDSTMKIYKDGSLWHTGTGLIRTMKDIKTFWIGAALWNESVAANGNIDEFAIWNKELDSVTLKSYMYKDLDADHPYKNNLLVYYQFNGSDPFTVKDESGNGFDGSIIGAQLPFYDAASMFRNIKNVNQRAQIKFEKGVYTSYIDSTIVFDTTWLSPSSLVLFNDLSNPGMATDTQLVWQPYYQYVFDNSGDTIDSLFIAADTTIHLAWTSYNTGPIPVLKRWELGRYITPYGINLSLGNGWTWTYDVSDYATLLHDSVYLSAGNWQELLDVKFLFIEGTPPRDPISIQNLWNGDYGWYANTNSDLSPKEVLIPSDAKNSRVKLRITGHGEDNNNCAEFCNNTAYLKVDGVQQFQRDIWRPTCPLNPLYPQGGTWIFERANWCPGAEVTTYDWELTPLVTPGDSTQLDLDLDYYSGSGGANYVTESQLVNYSAPNFSLDAEVYDILSPNDNLIYRRHNPVCSNPLIVIRNDGTTPLTSATITYGVEGSPPATFQWTGNLNFLDTAQVQLGSFFAPSQATSNKFTATISNPNGGADENPQNDAATSTFAFPPQYPQELVIEVKTNNHGQDNSYTVTDDAGNVYLSKDNLSSNTTYRDTLELANGCYTFRLLDSGEDGLYFWFYPDYGNGFVHLKDANTGAVKKNFSTDFGAEIYQQFTVGYYLNTPELPQVNHFTVEVYPNPVSDLAWADIFLPEKMNADAVVTDVSGRIVFHQSFFNILSEGLSLDFSNQPSGVYFLRVKAGNEMVTKKIVVGR